METQIDKTNNLKNAKTIYKRNIKINYFYSFIKGINLTNGIWMLYLVFKGMTLFEIGLLEGIYHVSSLIMETPTGAIADIFGRKSSRLMGLGFVALSAMFMVISHSFWGCAFAFFLTALSNNFESGAAEALIYDSLLLMGEEATYMKITGRLEVVYQLSSVLGLVIGGLIGTFDYALIYGVMIILACITLGIGIYFKEPEIHSVEHIKRGVISAVLGQYTDSFKILKNSKRLIYVIFFGAIVSTFLTLSFYYLQVAWKENGILEWQIGIFLGISSLCAAVGGYFAERIEKRLGEASILRYFPVVISFAIPTFYFMPYGFIGFSILSVIESVIFVATRDYINTLIPSDKRATIISFDSAVFSLCMICLFPLFGFVSDRIGISFTFLFLGGIFGLLTLINFFVLHGVRQRTYSK